MLRMVTSPNSLEKCHNLVVSSGGKNPELGVCLLVALTPTFMSLATSKLFNNALLKFKLKGQNSSKQPSQALPSWYFWKLHMGEACAVEK